MSHPPHPSLPSLHAGGEERKGEERPLRGVPLFEDRGPSPPSCSFLSPEEGMTAGKASATRRGGQKRPRGLTLHLRFSSRKRPRFTLWSSMETKTPRKQTRGVARRSTGACRTTAGDSGKSTTKTSRRKNWIWSVRGLGGLGPHARRRAERFASLPLPPRRPPRRSPLQPYSYERKMRLQAWKTPVRALPCLTREKV